MTLVTLPHWAALLLVSTIAAAFVLWVTGILAARRKPGQGHLTAEAPRNHFLFDGNTLVDHDIVAPSKAFDEIEDWSGLRDWLSSRFDNLPDDLNTLPETEQVVFQTERSSLHLARTGGQIRIFLADETAHSAAAWHDTISVIQSEHSAGSILETAPDPIWRTGADGAVLWHNKACAELEDADGRMPNIKDVSDTRISMQDKEDDAPRWYELRTREDGDQRLHFATNITPIIQAETAQREFVQTLTKTFANLTIGLAIFDKNRQLALFNPALIDLTGVQVSFLSARPDLMDVFDQLREQQVMPEPKNYADWRAQIRDVVAQANTGLYQEIWTLPTGLTYKVTGRPHPDGAVAFLFEDISAEISLTRRFRTQIDLRQSVLDHMGAAIAVISPNNLLMFCNRPCTDLLRVDPDTSFADMSLRDLLSACRDSLQAGEPWLEFEQQLLNDRASNPEHVTLDHPEGKPLLCELKLLSGGIKMLIFSPLLHTHTDLEIKAAS
ncbi:PAS-domain containing protein [Roseovarius sp. 2305UL8-3]|uniref:PAS-domain containing protein n=1 Tax=Roseovarius conchicola TaxID=3121636 RepID=UPI0035285511